MDYVLSLLGPLAQGAAVTLKLFAITLALAVPLGLVLALARVSRWRALSAAVNGYIWLMRGTPLMLQMLFIYFALPFVPVIGVRLPDFPAAVAAFALNYAAYFAEIFRAGIQSVDRGQYEAAKVLAEHDVLVKVDMGTGEASAKAWGCDLTYDYVKINGDYRT